METVLDQVCASCGSNRLPDGNFCLFCGDILSDPDAKKQRRGNVKQSAPAPEPVQYAGFWLRVWAASVDVAVEVIGAVLLTRILEMTLNPFRHHFKLSPYDSQYAAGEAFIVILAVGSWLYCAFAESSAWGATLGKRLLGLKVVTGEGGRISFGQATVRHLMKFLSFFCLMIGFLMSGWTKRRQALHDMPCDCLVIRVTERPFSLLKS